MPQNSQELIQTVVALVAQASYHLSPQDTRIVLRHIPAGGTALFLPNEPNDGDAYGFADVDGSASSASPVGLVLQAESLAAGIVIQGAPQVLFEAAYAAATATYSAKLKAWSVEGSATTLTAPGDAWSDMTGNVPLPDTNPHVVTSTTLRSQSTGSVIVRFAAICTGDSTGGTVVMSVNHGAAGNPADFTWPAVTVPPNSSVTVAGIYPYEPFGTDFPIGANTTFNLLATANAGGHLTFIAPGGANLEAQELPA
jgi:hypothetical protein